MKGGRGREEEMKGGRGREEEMKGDVFLQATGGESNLVVT